MAPTWHRTSVRRSTGSASPGSLPTRTLVALKVCTEVGFCFADSVAAALRYAGDVGLDVVNLSLFADPFLYYCKSDAEQKAILKEIESAAKYAQQKGVLIVASAGNEVDDLQHPEIDAISPDWPPDTAITREVKNNCRVAPAELSGVLTVSSVGPVGYPGYDLWIADYSSVGMSVVDVTAPGGDYFRATNTRQDAVLGALSSTGDADNSIWEIFDAVETGGNPLNDGLTVLADGGFRYGFLNGTSMASPHAAGVAAIIEKHPGWSPGAVKAAVQRTANQLDVSPGAACRRPKDMFRGRGTDLVLRTRSGRRPGGFPKLRGDESNTTEGPAHRPLWLLSLKSRSDQCFRFQPHRLSSHLDGHLSCADGFHPRQRVSARRRADPGGVVHRRCPFPVSHQVSQGRSALVAMTFWRVLGLIVGQARTDAGSEDQQRHDGDCLASEGHPSHVDCRHPLHIVTTDSICPDWSGRHTESTTTPRWRGLRTFSFTAATASPDGGCRYQHHAISLVGGAKTLSTVI